MGRTRTNTPPLTLFYHGGQIRGLAKKIGIELTQNGMIDGQSSTLPMSERLQRLREYALRFRNGTFDHEDLTAHEEYANSFLNDPSWTFLEVSSNENSSVIPTK